MSEINCCDRCGAKIGNDRGPSDGWDLENGETAA